MHLCGGLGLRCDGPGEKHLEPAGDHLPALRRRHGVSATGAEGLPLPPRQPGSATGVFEVPRPAVPESERHTNWFYAS